MNRRQLFNLLGAAGFAALTGEVYAPEKTIFLPQRVPLSEQLFGSSSTWNQAGWVKIDLNGTPMYVPVWS